LQGLPIYESKKRSRDLEKALLDNSDRVIDYLTKKRKELGLSKWDTSEIKKKVSAAICYIPPQVEKLRYRDKNLEKLLTEREKLEREYCEVGREIHFEEG